jgi:hypothetical protein
MDGCMFNLYQKDMKTWRYNKQALRFKYKEADEDKKLVEYIKKGATKQSVEQFLSENNK